MKRRSMLIAMFACPASVWAHSFRKGDINIGHAWGLPNQQGGDGQVFMPLLNAGKEADALVGARSDVAGFIELRANNHYVDPALKQFLLEPGKPLAMRPTANHLRLVGLAKPLVSGDHINVVLDFLNAGEIEIEVHVQLKSGE